jgi:hypothetical protein
MRFLPVEESGCVSFESTAPTFLPLQGTTVEDRAEWNQYIGGMPDEQLEQLGLTRAQLELTRYCKDNIQVWNLLL